MESENRSTSYRRRRSGSELFICFTSRNSSSVKVCSKSAQSPGRNSGKFSNSSSSSLSCSLSRRLRSNGSIKGSPMFPTGSQKKKGASSETTTAAAEPSSPKVTCIGQVRVKTKKQGQKFRKKKSKRRDVSFRKTDDGSFHSQPLQQQQQQQECLPHRSQRWVHLPLSICDALRAFGAEFSCLLPCKPSCLTRRMKKRRQPSSTERNTSSCRQIFEKWVMTSLHESEHQSRDNHNNNNNETELVVSRREDGIRRERREEMVGEIEIHISEEKRVSICNEEEEVEAEEEEGRVSICIPPRNALLLMRCRSEPLRMSALANHFWESPVKDKKEEEDLHPSKQVLVAEEDDVSDSDSDSDEEEVEDGEEDKDSDDDEVEDETEVKLQLIHPKEDKLLKNEESTDISLEEHHEEENQDNAEELMVKKIEEDVNESGFSAIEPLKEEEEEEEHEILTIEENEEEPRLQMPEEKELVVELKEERIESRRPSTSSRRASFSSCTRSIHEEEEVEEVKEREQIPEAEPVKVVDFEEKVNNATEDKATNPRTSVEKRGTMKINNRKNSKEEELPDCLLLMMCEPKLSMEVSKETWVCSTDFIRYRPERRVVQNNGGGGGDHDHSKKRNSTDSKGRHSLDSKNRLSTDSKSRLSTDSNPGNGRPPHHSKHQKPPTPPRRSISKPTPPPSVAKSTKPAPPPAKLKPPVEVSATPSAVAKVIEQKLVNAVAYEPLVLTRCNSEPMRSSAKLAPEACFWKNMKLEPHTQGPPNLGVGAAAGIGF